jgi:gliding motility-associated-like protein
MAIPLSDIRRRIDTIDTQLVRVFRVTDIQVPDAFSPNGDGNNDRLYPFLIGIVELKYFRVYNRWGNLVFETKNSNPSLGWDGTFKGQLQPAETFIWMAEGIDLYGQSIKRGGNTILIR